MSAGNCRIIFRIIPKRNVAEVKTRQSLPMTESANPIKMTDHVGIEDDSNTCNSGSDSDERSEISITDLDMEDFDPENPINAAGSGVKPYQFEPYNSESDSNDESKENENDSDDQHSGDRLHNTNWCTCDNCHLMEARKENVCCQEIGACYQKCMEDEPPASCITMHSDFQAVCFNKGVLDTAYNQYRQQYSVDDSAKRPDERYRHVAYRQLVRWCWVYLGKEIRRVLPSCAVNAIRRTFPSPDGKYTGFKLLNH